MTMRPDVVTGPGVSSLFGALPYLRIAVPSWRFVGIQRAPEPVKAPTLSREELAALFEGDLNPTRRRSKLTDGEQGEKQLAHRIRQALYT